MSESEKWIALIGGGALLYFVISRHTAVAPVYYPAPPVSVPNQNLVDAQAGIGIAGQALGVVSSFLGSFGGSSDSEY